MLKGEGPEDLQDLVMKLEWRSFGSQESQVPRYPPNRPSVNIWKMVLLEKLKDVVEYQGGDQRSLMILINFQKPSIKEKYRSKTRLCSYYRCRQLARGVQILVHGEDGKKFDPASELQNFARLEPR